MSGVVKKNRPNGQEHHKDCQSHIKKRKQHQIPEINVAVADRFQVIRGFSRNYPSLLKKRPEGIVEKWFVSDSPKINIVIPHNF
jgi:hypothetical protein